MRTVTLAAAAGIMSICLTACGSGSSSVDPDSLATTGPASPSVSSPSHPVRTTPAPQDDQAELKAAVQAYSDAFLTGKPLASYALLSQRCRARMSLSHWTGLITAAKAQYGTALPIKSFHADISGDLARATYTYDVAAINQDAEPWVKEAGHWKEDDC